MPAVGDSDLDVSSGCGRLPEVHVTLGAARFRRTLAACGEAERPLGRLVIQLKGQPVSTDIEESAPSQRCDLRIVLEPGLTWRGCEASPRHSAGPEPETAGVPAGLAGLRAPHGYVWSTTRSDRAQPTVSSMHRFRRAVLGSPAST